MDKRRNAGFTIVELLIVIVVVAILAGIVIMAYNGMQARASDTERTSDMQAVAKKLELFYVDNGYYPGFSQLNTPSWRETNLPGLSDGALTPPGLSSVVLVNTATPTTSSQYAYRNGVTCTQCVRFFLHWRSGVDGAIKTLQSLNGH